MGDRPTEEDLDELQSQIDQLKEEKKDIAGLEAELEEQGKSQQTAWRQDLKTVQDEIADIQKTPGYGEAHLSGLPGTEDGVKTVNASNQIEYFSNQIVKWDMEVLAVTPSGVSFLGTEFIKFSWVEALQNSGWFREWQNRLPSWLHRDSEANVTRTGDGARGGDSALQGTVHQHGEDIRALYRMTRDTAAAGRSQVSARADVTQNRGNRVTPRGRSYAAESAQLRAVANAYDAVLSRTAALEQRLGT